MTLGLGIDIGGTNIKAAVVTAAGGVLSQVSTPTARQAEALVETVADLVRTLAGEQGAPAAIGLAAPGLAARDGRSIAWMQGRLDAVQGLDWTLRLGSAQRIVVLNDAQAAAVGEAWLGAARGKRHVVLLTLGTGVGGGVIAHGRLLQGRLGRAGHLGHLCLDPDGAADLVGTPGSLEDAVGDCTVAQRSGGRFSTTRELVAAASAGDAEAQRVWQRSVHVLACGIVSLLNVLDPEVVVLGGGIAEAGDALFKPLRAEVDQMEWRPTGEATPIVPAKLGAYAGAIGAARNALVEKAGQPR